MYINYKIKKVLSNNSTLFYYNVISNAVRNLYTCVAGITRA